MLPFEIENEQTFLDKIFSQAKNLKSVPQTLYVSSKALQLLKNTFDSPQKSVSTISIFSAVKVIESPYLEGFSYYFYKEKPITDSYNLSYPYLNSFNRASFPLYTPVMDIKPHTYPISSIKTKKKKGRGGSTMNLKQYVRMIGKRKKRG